jgi:hypothetical protein
MYNILFCISVRIDEAKVLELEEKEWQSSESMSPTVTAINEPAIYLTVVKYM